MKKKLLAGLVLSTLVLTAFSACVKKEEVKPTEATTVAETTSPNNGQNQTVPNTNQNQNPQGQQ